MYSFLGPFVVLNVYSVPSNCAEANNMPEAEPSQVTLQVGIDGTTIQTRSKQSDWANQPRCQGVRDPGA
jgi:hypothetical protein